MSTHGDCGEDIRWVHRSDDHERFMPPLEFAGYRYVILEDDTAVQQPTYIIHHCNPEKVVAWGEYQTKLDAAKLANNSVVRDAKRSNYQIARERDREEAWVYALKFICPVAKCSQPAGEKCLNLAELKRGRTTHCLNPHPERCDPDFTKFEGSTYDKKDDDHAVT